MRTNHATVLSVLLLVVASSQAQESPRIAPIEADSRPPEMILDDGSIHIAFGEPRIVLPRGLQPSLLCTRSGALILQAQVPEKPFPSKRIAYFSAMCTEISRDGGSTWTVLPLSPGENGLNMEAGAIQLRDGSILALDTYVPPDAKPGEGIGQIYVSTDDWKTVDGPRDVPFDLPNAKFDGSSDDGGRPHAAQRAHRRILELPDGDLLATLYGWLEGDVTPSTYAPKMMKTRALLVRSSDRGRSWRLVSTIAVDPAVGTEGFGEPVLCRTSKGPNPNRLICLMRTGRNLYRATSDDLGATWSPPREWIVAGLDVNRVELWADHYRDLKDPHGRPIDENNLDELRGAAVDPDLIELRSGLLVATFGVRIPQKASWRRPDHPWNGNYLAVSRDHGETWDTVARITSGVLTTHYTAIEETPTDDMIYMAYDLGGWTKGMRRDVVGRTVQFERRAENRP